jgi:hypothetical protein
MEGKMGSYPNSFHMVLGNIIGQIEGHRCDEREDGERRKWACIE